MDEVASLQDHFPILATESRADERTRVLKQGETFAVFDRFGDLPSASGEYGIYHTGTRHLSRCELLIGGQHPLLLSSTIRKSRPLFTTDLTTPDVPAGDGTLALPKGELHVFRTKFLWDATCHERLEVSNYGLTRIRTELTVHVDADFADVFEVRGTARARRGRRLENRLENGRLRLAYRGLDNVLRQTTIGCEPLPAAVSDSTLTLPVDLRPGESTTFELTVVCETDRAPVTTTTYGEAFDAAARALLALRGQQCGVSTSNHEFNEWLSRSGADVTMMTTRRAEGLYPYAGVPWFSTPFGRDGIITALEFLWVDPQLARGVLSCLAATQASVHDEARDAQPGKILHEMRDGEMAALGEVPFGRYYGSVDSTPLFVMLAGAFYERTGDRAFIESLWDHIERALEWIDRHGDVDGDGLVEYERQSPNGLVNQGWKDSGDAISHEDGAMPEGPIALCEVQAYVYAAWQAASRLATALGRAGRAADLRERAERTREAFERSFWLGDLDSYALALDGQKRPCRVRASNAGHCLYAGIASEERAARISELLASEALYSGWGIRTLAAGEVRYNPMSYHNGSIWPHDNALIAQGLARYGFKPLALKILSDMFDAASFLELRRMPELFCGFRRRPGEGPTLYPIACLPQAWAAGSVFMLLQAVLGLEIDGVHRQVSFVDPVLPEWLSWLRIENLSVGDGIVDLLCERHPHDVGISLLRRHGDVRVVHIT